MTTYLDPQLNDSDLELLSAYIDRQLTAAERATLEQRLANDPALQLALDELRTTVGLLRELPPTRPPRSFALDPKSVSPKRSWSFPWMQLGSALVAATLLVVFGFVLARSSSKSSAPAAPMAAAAPTAAPELAPAAAAPTAVPAAIAPAAEPAATSAPAAGAPAAAPLPTSTAQSAAIAPAAEPAATSAPAAGAPAALEAAPKTAAQPTEAPAALDNGAAAGPQPSAAAANAAGSTASDAAGAPNSGAARQAAGTPTPPPFIAQIATSGSTAPDTQALEQQPAPTPQPNPNGGRSSALLIGALILIVFSAVIIWLFSRRRS